MKTLKDLFLDELSDTSNDEALGGSDGAGTSENKTRAKMPAGRGGGRAGKSNHKRIESLV